MSGSTKEQLLSKIMARGDDYARYQFTRGQDDILKSFFDLALEYDSLEDYYKICVLILKQSMSVECRLYLADQFGDLQLVQASDLEQEFPVGAPADITVQDDAFQHNDSWFFPVYFGGLYTDKQPPAGLLQVISPLPLSEQEQFFLGVYVQRIGVSLGHTVSACQNIQHIKFVNGLVTDIEHNVIIPNMYFKHLFNKLRKKIVGLGDLERDIFALQKSMGIEKNESCQLVIHRVADLQNSLSSYHQEMQKHHTSCSLFLESLFRKDHFETGELVLHPKKCFVELEIIDPQLEHFAQRFAHHGISINRPSDMRDEEIALNVDVGLLAQVYANLFSNALKYAAPTICDGRDSKIVAYGREYSKSCLGDGVNGIKFNVFSTGPHLPKGEAELLFDEGFRGGNIGRQSGKGHGLAFIRQVIEIHGGRVTYEAVAGGNNFCFYLPLSDEEG